MQSSVELPQKIKIGTASWPSDSISGNLSEETLNTTLEWYKHPDVHCSIIYNNQYLEAAQVSMSRWLDKITMVHLPNGILLSHKKEESFTLSNKMDGPGEHYDKDIFKR